MASSDMFPEKFAMYFASMNPLASKIYADIEGIEDFIKSHGPPSITYSEKCSIVDKFLIYDHLNKNDANGKLNKRLSEFQRYQLHKSETSLNSLLDKDPGLISETELVQPVYYNDSTLDQDHESVLLMSVAPKKPEKYVYDDNNYWIDEHSATYSSCTPAQAKACKLQQFLDSLPPPPQPMTHRRHSDHPHKYRAPPIPTFQNDNERHGRRDDGHGEEEEDDDDYIIRPSRKTSMAGLEDDEGRYSKIDKMDSEKSKVKYGGAVSVFGGLFGDAPPAPQKKDGIKEAEKNNEQDLPNQVKNTDLIAELQAKLKKGKTPASSDGISPRSSTKLNKPKAPPPPPPGAVKPPGGAVKVCTEDASKNRGKESSTSTGNKKSPNREITDDFIVDVSSPCKIVTPKTGLDFLDNW